MLSRPDVLVLGGGGVLGEAWMMGLLAGVEDATGFELRHCEHFVGTSAGAIVAAYLAAGEPLRRPRSTAEAEVEPATARPAEGLAAAALVAARRAGSFALAAASSFAPLALGLAAPGGAVMRGLMLRRLPRPQQTLDGVLRHVDRLGARFDGRLRVAAVDRASGRRVMFGSPGAPSATVAQAVTASCTVPWLFAPFEIDGREYVDGGVWSPTNLDAAPAGRQTEILCLNPTASLPGSANALAVIRRVSRTAVSLEALALRRRGVSIQMVGPNVESAATMGTNFMEREPQGRVLAAGYRQGLELGRSAGSLSRRAV
jgi:NTE family protein